MGVWRYENAPAAASVIATTRISDHLRRRTIATYARRSPTGAAGAGLRAWLAGRGGGGGLSDIGANPTTLPGRERVGRRPPRCAGRRTSRTPTTALPRSARSYRSSASSRIAPASASASPGSTRTPQPYSSAIDRRFGPALHRGDVRLARGQDPVELARHDEAGQARLEGDEVNVGGAERLRRACPCPGRPGTRRSSSPRESPRVRSRAFEAPSPTIANTIRRSSRKSAAASIVVSRSCDSPTLPECITTNASGPQPFSVRNGGWRVERLDGIAVGPVVDRGDPCRRHAELEQPPVHVAADRDEPVGAREQQIAEAVGAAAMASGFRSTPSSIAMSGKMSFTTSTNGRRRTRAAIRPIRPIGGGSVSATTTSGRRTDKAPTNEVATYVA